MKSIPKKYLGRLVGFDKDPNDDSVMVTLAYGWRFDDSYDEDASHVKGFDNWNDALKALKTETTPCNCKECKAHKEMDAIDSFIKSVIKNNPPN